MILQSKSLKICGIDEAGRGALAGDLVIAGCVLLKDIKGLNDSKKLSPKKREELFDKIIKNSKYLIIYFSNSQIDELGLSKCLKSALMCFKRYFKDYELIFDGNTDYKTNIKTIIKADSVIKEVSAASILAKVSRDKSMELLDNVYPNYGYKKHKGYGTKAHLEAIQKYGPTPLLRKSFKIKREEKSLFDTN
ncbi:ribonuclease HII [Campylobacter pinnipediorum subsp. caledonicus]|uniref:Ribonuclease HII n=1 Tax=Campylobacter pinnipediorum subsp. caledonicus TaxID=1874362 RepID=A0A1S6U9L5_9BACT|nr:ribonuclease HII [Campylobacter pinnipediorum subsp. caledonicus]AQW88375.1 ribonuclease HII [Campylobacter pinnipediorum subsp. caledonicus]